MLAAGENDFMRFHLIATILGVTILFFIVRQKIYCSNLTEL